MSVPVAIEHRDKWSLSVRNVAINRGSSLLRWAVPNFDRSYPGAGVPNIPPDTLPQSPPVHRPAGRHRFNVSAFATTLTDDSAIAAPANTGLSKPRAANGIPSAL